MYTYTYVYIYMPIYAYIRVRIQRPPQGLYLWIERSLRHSSFKFIETLIEPEAPFCTLTEP